jgi:hypothetical protein
MDTLTGRAKVIACRTSSPLYRNLHCSPTASQSHPRSPIRFWAALLVAAPHSVSAPPGKPREVKSLHQGRGLLRLLRSQGVFAGARKRCMAWLAPWCLGSAHRRGRGHHLFHIIDSDTAFHGHDLPSFWNTICRDSPGSASGVDLSGGFEAATRDPSEVRRRTFPHSDIQLRPTRRQGKPGLAGEVDDPNPQHERQSAGYPAGHRRAALVPLRDVARGHKLENQHVYAGQSHA